MLRLAAKASFPRGQPPRHRVLWTWKGLVWTVGLCDAIEAKSTETQALLCLSRHSPLYFTPMKASFPGCPGNQVWACKNAAAFWTFSVTTAWPPVLTGTSVHKAWGSVMIAVLRKWHGLDTGQIHFKQSRLSGSQIPNKTKPPAQDKMLSIHNCCRNANQNDNGKSNSTSHNGHPHKSTNNKCGKEPGSKRISLSCQWEDTLATASIWTVSGCLKTKQNKKKTTSYQDG